MIIFDKVDIELKGDVWFLNDSYGNILRFRRSSVSSLSCQNLKSTNVKLFDGTEFNVRIDINEASDLFMQPIDYSKRNM